MDYNRENLLKIDFKYINNDKKRKYLNFYD